ncbi:MAG: dTMP kinase [Leptolyngbyaceae cyanobacterium MO_188.B28]|nr:dTMP kinase [Leptolyngbyaceae cyanobacterium MO_188.B28]
MPGKLIVFEGVEGCGKTTQMQRLYNWLIKSDVFHRLQTEGHLQGVVMTREPGGTDLGKVLRQLLLEQTVGPSLQDRTELLLYAADRSQHVEEMIRPHLEQGFLVLCDRYTDSTVAYQGYGRELDLSLIQQLNQIAAQGVKSELTFWLKLEVELGLARTQKRGKADRIEQAELAFHHRVQRGFEALAAAHPERIVAIDASLSEAVVSQTIQTLLEQKLNQWSPPLSTN